jgi:hypothetical protein
VTWAPITMRWPEQATQWMGDLAGAQDLAGAELGNSSQRLDSIAGMATTTPSPVGAAAAAAGAAGRAALAGQLADAPACLAITPFQPGIGQGQGNQRYLSAPNLVQLLAGKLMDNDPSRPAGSQCALVVMFLGTRYDQFAAALARFNALMPIPALQKAERRAGQLARLEAEKWDMPVATTMPSFAPLPLHKCTVTLAAQQAMSGQLAALEAYGADRAPMADLAELAGKKAGQQAAKAQQLQELKQSLAGGTADTSMRARFLGPGDAGVLRTALLEGDTPGHEWVLSAGLLLVGSPAGLSFVKELVGL